MSEIKYVSPSALAHYDEKIKKVITEIETGSDSKVTQTPTTSNEEYSLLLSPSGQTEETNTTSYFNSDVVLNPSTKTISANIDGNAKTATSADSATKDGNGNVITETYAEKETIALKSATGTNISITESKEAPMILNYAPVNLLPNTYNTITDNGITFTVNADGSITVNGTATAQARIYFQSNLKFDFDTVISCKCSGGNVNVYSDLFGNLFEYRKVSAGESLFAFFVYVNKGVTIDNVTAYPMIEKGDTVHNYVPYTGYNITSSNADGSESTTVSINAKTTFPVTGLKSYDGTTNVSNDYSTNMQLTYATNEAGQGILKEIETKAEINGSNATGDWNINITGNAATATSASNIANNLTTTVSGYSLDARQGKALGDVLFQSTSGKFIVSSTGLKIYWGTTSEIGRSNHNHTITFSTPFTSENYAVICTHNGVNTHYASSEAVVSSKTVNSCVISSYCVEGATEGDFKYDYLIIGY